MKSKRILERLFEETAGFCVFCDKITHESQRSRDHILPRSMGGSNSLINYAPACKKCNANRGVKMPASALVANRWVEYVKAKENPSPELIKKYRKDHLNKVISYSKFRAGNIAVRKFKSSSPYKFSPEAASFTKNFWQELNKKLTKD